MRPVRKTTLRSLAVMAAGIATAAASVAVGAGSAAASTASASAPASCAAVATVRTYVAARHATAARGQEVMREARALCSDPGVARSTGRMKVSLTADDTLSVSAITTTQPTAACTADVEGQLPPGTADVTTAVQDACATQLVTDASVAAVAAAPTGTDPAPTLPVGTDIPSRFPTGAPVFQVTESAHLCSIISCVAWNQYLKELYFIQYNSWDWHHLAGFSWSYVNCDQNGGVGFTVSVDSCFWGGPNPGYHNNPVTANVDFHVTFLFKGVPISAPHSLTLTDWVNGAIDVSSGK